MNSLLRDLQYKEISRFSIDGEILDLGGSTRSGYHSLLKGNHKILTANIDKDYGCDIIFDIEKKFPLEDSRFDAVLIINVLEHIYDFKNVLKESSRVLRKNGTILLAVPFFHHIHGSPSDYFRYTDCCFEKMLKDAGFNVLEIKEMGDGIFSVIAQLFTGIFIIGQITRFTFSFFDKTLSFCFKKYKKLRKKIPLGYFVVAQKI